MHHFYLLSRGENGHSSSSGGGAGGSIWIETISLQGDGVFAVSGGNGGSQGGGGSGGMLALYYEESPLLFDISIQGGNGRVGGASGMALFKRKGSTLEKLLLDNKNQGGGTSTLVCQRNAIDYYFNEIEIRRGAKLDMISCARDQAMSLITNKLTGDKTGALEVRANQDVYLSVPSRGRPTPVELTSDIFVRYGGQLSLPESVLLSKGVNLRVQGSLVGIKNITVSRQGRLLVQSPGSTSYRQNTSTFNLDTLYVKRAGIVESLSPGKVWFHLKLLKLDYGSRYLIRSKVSRYDYKLEQVRGNSFNEVACPHGVVRFNSSVFYNPCGGGVHFSTHHRIPYQVEQNISQDGVYRLVNVTLYRPYFNITCDYANFRLLPGQSCVHKPGHYRYRSLEIHSEATMSFEADEGRTVTNTLEVERLRIYADGKLRGLPGTWTSTSLRTTDGGTYGGKGGKNNHDEVNGKVRYPESYGSSGGGSQGYRGAGGGQLRIRVTQGFINDGLVEVNGGNAGMSGGGGSGGSLLVAAEELKGSGSFQANGGQASARYGGSGAGGRIAFYVNSSIESFLGNYEVYSGYGYYRGASGTIFIQDEGSRKGTLIVKGTGDQTVRLPSYTSLSQLDSLHVAESATFEVSVPKLVVDILHTDSSGKVIVPSQNSFNITKLPTGESISCDLDVSGLLDVRVPVTMNGPRKALNLNGVVRTPRLTVGKGKIVQWNNGELKTDSLILRQSSAVKIENSSEVNIDEIYVGANARLIVARDDVLIVSKHLTFDAYSSLHSKASTKSINITADTVQINSFASLSVTAGGYSRGPGFSGTSGIGGSHGGQAGGASKDLLYGSLFEPLDFGSGSLDTANAPQRGGGRLVMNVANVMILDGVVHADGGGSAYNGGGSGGSIKVTTKILKGSGVLRSNGVQGGSGGRIALYVNDRKGFSGEITCYGGCGSSCGAAGTVFIKEYLVGIPYNTTIVYNAGRRSAGVTSIMHGSQSEYTLEKLRLLKEGRVEVVHPNTSQPVKIRVLELEGDFTGQIRVVKNQKMFLGASSASGRQPFVLRCAISVENGAEMVLASRVFVGETSLSPSLDVAGRVEGSQELIVGRNALVSISPAGVIGTKSSQPGTLTFRTLDVLSGGRIVFNRGGKTQMEVRAVLINIEYNGVLESPYIAIKTPSLNVHMGGKITTNGLGYGSSTGPGAGGTSAVSLWYGGSHGGCGGGHTSQSCPIYGSLFGSIEPGSGGGSGGGSNGGSGGGVIILDVEFLHLDGVVSSDGGRGVNRAGGGSGGSIHATIKKAFSGRGVLRALGGGAGTRGGGGGGGGRVYVNAQTAYEFKGTFDTKGGSGFNMASGSPGTVWILENMNGLITKSLIIDNKDTNTNNNLPVILKENRILSYNIDLLRLMGNVSLTPDHHMTVQRLVTSPLSTISVPNGLILEVETNLQSTSPACSFHVATNGEIRLPSSVTFLGPDNKFSGTITGVLDMIIGEGRRTEFSVSARTALFVNGNYTFVSKRGEYKFASLLLKSNAVVSFEKSDLREVPLVFGTLELRYGSVLRGSWLKVQAVGILVHSGAKIDLEGKGYPGGRGTGRGVFTRGYGTGAGHGGVGGGPDGSGGRWYGDMASPAVFGSGGGSRYRVEGGSGGGYLHVVTSKQLTVDGSLLVSGSDCTAIGCGGGSGGTIYVHSRSLAGVGVIGSRGGDGDKAGGGGGGSGGRIAIHLNVKMAFEGMFEVHGGSGRYLGAAGTIYIEDEKDKLSKKKVIVNNKRMPTNVKPLTALTSNVESNVILDELELIGPASVSFFDLKKKNLKVEISISKLSADIHSEIVVQSQQIIFTQVTEARETSLTLRTNLVIEDDADFVAASELFVDGASLRVDGRLLNVRDMTLESGSTVMFSEKSQTGLFVKGYGHVFLTTPGTQQFGSLKLKSGSSFNAPENLRINVAKMVTKSGVLIRVKDLEIRGSTVVLERGTTVTADGVSTGGLGTGSSSSGIGSGGSFASPGGPGRGQTMVNKAHGSLYRPQVPGSAGGDGASSQSAGKGGGMIVIFASLLQVDGKMTANGGNGKQGSNAGGGSGGSIMLSVDNLVGKGEISADGGLGDGAGGCGSGGRIAIHLKSNNTFKGTIETASGACRSSLSAGGPGTQFIEEVRDKRPYRRLVVDNRGRNWNAFVTLSENQIEYDFNEVTLRGGASIQLLGQPLAHQTLNIGLLSGDRSGLIHVHRNQTVIISEKTPARVPANLKVDEGGLMLLPHSVIVVGQRTYSVELRGTILGMRNLDVARGRKVKLYERSILGIGTDRQNFKASKGTLEFGSLSLHSSSSLIIDDLNTIKISADKIDVKFDASLISSSLYFTVSRLHVEIGGRIDCSGGNAVMRTKSASSSLSTGTGAGHGSDGGEGADGQSGIYYGSLYNPTDRGRNGGAGPRGSHGGRGGGSLLIKVGTSLIVDGIVTVAGANAPPGSDAGGGSGGSVHVVTNSYRGFGVIDVRGGSSGGSRAGSGAGGRIAIYSKTRILYRGTYEASGGSGTAGKHGGPGTIYLQDLQYKKNYIQLRFGHRTGDNLVYVTLHEGNLTEFVFSEIVVKRRTAIRLKQDGEERSLRTGKLTGDGTGYVYVGQNHTFYLQGSTGYGGVARPPVNFNIDKKGTGVLDSSVYVVGDGTSSPNGHALTINGRMIGMQHLFLTKGRRMVFKAEAQIANYVNGSLEASLPGTFVLATLEVHDRGKLTFLTANGMRGLAGKIDIKYGARIFADKFDMSKYEFRIKLLYGFKVAELERAVTHSTMIP